MPRLIEGQTAPGIATKQARRKQIVQHVIYALEESLAAPREVAATTLNAFRSYRKLAHWTDTDRDIAPIAENTLRKYLDELYPGGVRAFEQARRKLLERAKRVVVASGTKASYQQSNRELKDENQILTNHILQFSSQYLDLLERTSNLADAHAFLQDYLKAHQRAYPNARHGFRVNPGHRDDG